MSLGLGYVGSRIRGERKARLSLCDEKVPLKGLVWKLWDRMGWSRDVWLRSLPIPSMCSSLGHGGKDPEP